MSTTRRRHRNRPPEPGDPEDGFALVEVLAASVILILIVVSLTNLLMDSLSVAVLSRQRQAAISLASDTIENAKALGQTALTAASAGTGLCTALVLPVQTVVPVLTCQTFSGGYQLTQNNTTFTVKPTIVAATASGAPDTVTVTVTWGGGQHTYLTSTQVGS